VSLRGRFVAYLAAAHVLFAGVAVPLLYRQRLWLIAVEASLAASLAVGLALVRRLFSGLELIRESAAYLSENDYSTRVRETGQSDLDALITVYNRMVDSLRAERLRLEEQHHFLAQILAVSPSGFLILDFDGRVDFANPSAESLLARNADELRGRTLAELASPLASALDGLSAGQAQVVALHGGRRVKCRRASFLDRGFSRSFVLLEEVTDELRRYEKAAYEKLIRMMSHEVNNSVGASNSLLHSCLAYARYLPAGDRADFERALSVAIGRTETLSRFMRSFADVVRLPKPTPQPCDVRALLEEVSRAMQPVAERSQVTLERDLGTQPAFASLDRVLFEQALVNVVKNAVEAAGAGGQVCLRLERPDGTMRVVVEDSGPGLSPEARDNLFTPFFTTKPEGQGIGLTLVQEVMRQHELAFSLDSPPGRKTRFTIVVPAVGAEP
jgi:two-component system nitrogen regulation sensor histidine kinase NtrY